MQRRAASAQPISTQPASAPPTPCIPTRPIQANDIHPMPPIHPIPSRDRGERTEERPNEQKQAGNVIVFTQAIANSRLRGGPGLQYCDRCRSPHSAQSSIQQQANLCSKYVQASIARGLLGAQRWHMANSNTELQLLRCGAVTASPMMGGAKYPNPRVTPCERAAARVDHVLSSAPRCRAGADTAPLRVQVASDCMGSTESRTAGKTSS